MRKVLWCVVAASVLACTDHGSPTQNNGLTLPPPHLTMTATSRVIATDGGARALEISAMMKNETDKVMAVEVDPNCPLIVQIQPDPTGEPQGSTAASDFCPLSGPMLAIAPGDSTVLTRVIGSDSLAAYGSGTFGLSALASTSTVLMAVWAGAVQLPLSATP
jgi:hypothetical protein